MRKHSCAVILILATTSLAQRTYYLNERFPNGYRYSVQSRVDLSGSLLTTGRDGKSKKLSLSGESSIDYSERVLALNASGEVERALRIFKRVKMERKVGGVDQSSSLRPAVYRIVQMRRDGKESPFSPDGPLTWAEIDLIRTDVFTPALRGLLPEKGVMIGDSWKASVASIRELTDMEKVEGELRCRLERVMNLVGRKHARVSFRGNVKGTNEDGPGSQRLEGFYYFDLESSHLSYLSLRGRHALMDAKGNEVGHVEGRFVLSRQVAKVIRGLEDEDLRRLTLTPNASNSLLLFESKTLKASFLYPRRWRVATSSGQQIMLDSAEGAGIVVTLDSIRQLPTTNKFYQEARTWLDKKKANVKVLLRPGSLQRRPTEVSNFSLQVDLNKRRLVMDYFLIRDRDGGATLAARLPDAKGVEKRRKEVEQIAKSVRRR